jgi:hypothetical protein
VEHSDGKGGERVVAILSVTSGSMAKPSAHSMCAQESSLHIYRIENGYRITNVTI